jgi:hypothetical protein
VATGLPVGRSTIERHHGRLWEVPEDGPGEALTFSIPGRFEATVDAGGSGVTRAPAAAAIAQPQAVL